MRKSNLKEVEVRDLETFEEIGDLVAADIREPELVPEGPWTLRHTGFSVKDAKDKDGNPQKCYNLRYEAFEPGEEVDPEAIERGGYESKTIFVRRYVSTPPAKAARDGTLAGLIKFIALHGVEIDARPVSELLKAMKGSLVGAQVGTRSWDDDNGDTHHDNTARDFHSVSAE